MTPAAPQAEPRKSPSTDLRALAVKTLQMLAVDAVEKAQSGHPGMPMGTADFASVLWLDYLAYNPLDPKWPGRDRFVLSAGHGSMLLYGLLHLAGYEVSLDDLKRFRQWGSNTPGHPEYGLTPGVEVTTGPLGQGVGNGIGMALAAKMLAARFGKAGEGLFDYRIFGIVSDGDLMEGVASEAASLAGHWGLGNVVYFYDDNKVTIDGKTDLAYSEDVARRFEAYGWHTVSIDGHDHAAIRQALDAGIRETARPTLILGRTVIGKGNPARQGTRKAHSDPFGAEEVRKTKETAGWPADPAFHVPEEVRELFRARARDLAPAYAKWQERLEALRKESPELAALWKGIFQPELPKDLESRLLAAVGNEASVATRVSGGKAMQEIAKILPGFCGGSADLAASVKTTIVGAPDVAKGKFDGRNLHFGVREHGMGAVLNGMALHGGIRPYGSTFMVFSDYMRPAMRLAALMELPVAYVFTHDSLFVGEDGPTHEPIEHVNALRLIPNLTVIRPADPRETAYAWAAALRNSHGPTALVLTRQNLPAIDPVKYPDVSGASRGGYVLSDAAGGRPDLILIGAGSELHLALAAKDALEKSRRLKIRVVSMPSTSIFDRQEKTYRDAVLPPACAKRVSIEAGTTAYWAKYVGLEGLSIGIDRFGASAPAAVLAKEFGFTPEKVLARIEAWLDGC